MPRLPEITDRTALAEADRPAFDYLAETRGAVRLPFSVVLNSPEICQRVAHVGTYVRFQSPLQDTVRELAVITAARERDVRYEWAAHEPHARKLGVSDAAIDAVAHRKALDGLDEDEALPIRLAREILNDKAISDATFDAAKARYGEAGVVDLIATVGYYAMLGCLLNGLRIEPAATAPQLP